MNEDQVTENPRKKEYNKWRETSAAIGIFEVMKGLLSDSCFLVDFCDLFDISPLAFFFFLFFSLNH